MDELHRTALEEPSVEKADIQIRRRPGPEKKDNPRSEKISCRLTKEEKIAGERFCKMRGVPEAKLLRASYLLVTAQAQNEVNEITDTIMRLVEADTVPHERTKLRINIREVLKRSVMFLVLIFLACFISSNSTIAKYMVYFYTTAKGFIYHRGDVFLYHKGDNGFEIMRNGEQ